MRASTQPSPNDLLLAHFSASANRFTKKSLTSLATGAGVVDSGSELTATFHATVVDAALDAAKVPVDAGAAVVVCAAANSGTAAVVVVVASLAATASKATFILSSLKELILLMASKWEPIDKFVTTSFYQTWLTPKFSTVLCNLLLRLVSPI